MLVCNFIRHTHNDMGEVKNLGEDFLASTFTLAGNKVVDNEGLFEKYSRKEFNGRNNYTKEIPFEKTLSNSANRIGNVTSGLTPYTGTWTVREVLHLLRRTNYGYKKSHADVLGALTMSQAVDLIMTVNNTPPSPPVNWYQALQPDENGLPYGADFTSDAINFYDVGVNTNVYRSETVKMWLLGQALNQDVTIKEKMVGFWFHFIPVNFNTVLDSNNIYCATNSARICYQYMKMFRDLAAGNFKTLITNMATQPAMMYYLNNQANTKTAPDENFAREIMELFTLGKDPGSNYTQQDVIAAAKVLTGWRVQNLNTANVTTDFVSELHDTSNKQFSSFFNNTVINNAGASELTAFINMIFSKEKVVSEYICRRLYRYFVYYDIDANIEANVIVPLAQTFVANNWEILPVLKQLFKSEHFYDMANRGVYIKSPLDLVVGGARTFNLTTNVSDSSNYSAQYQLWNTINVALMSPMAQVMGEVPNVSGWPAFYQNPSFHQFWINAVTTQKRFLYLIGIFESFTLTANGLTTKIEVDVIAFAKQFPNATIQDPDLLIAECVKYLLPLDISKAERDKLKLSSLLYGQTNNAYWTTSWNLYTSSPTNATYVYQVKARLKALLSSITQLAEFQLM